MATKKKSSSTRSAAKRPAASRSTSERKNRPSTAAQHSQRNQMWAVVWFAVGILVACITFIEGQNLWLSLHNALFGLFGIGAYLVAPMILYISIMSALDRFKTNIQRKLLQMFGMVVLICGIIQVLGAGEIEGAAFLEKVQNLYLSGVEKQGGGVCAGLLGWPLMALCGKIGAAIIIILLIFIFFMVLTGFTLIDLFLSLKRPVSHLRETYEETIETAREARRQSAEARERRFDFDVPLGPEGGELKMPQHPVKSDKALWERTQEEKPVPKPEEEKKPAALEPPVFPAKKERPAPDLRDIFKPTAPNPAPEPSQVPPLEDIINKAISTRMAVEGIDSLKKDLLSPVSPAVSTTLSQAPPPIDTDKSYVDLLDRLEKTPPFEDTYQPKTQQMAMPGFPASRPEQPLSQQVEASLEEQGVALESLEAEFDTPPHPGEEPLSPPESSAPSESAPQQIPPASEEPEPQQPSPAPDTPVQPGPAEEPGSDEENGILFQELPLNAEAPTPYQDADVELPAGPRPPVAETRQAAPPMVDNEIVNIYSYPPVSLLTPHQPEDLDNVTEELQANATRLVDTLKSFGVQTRITNISRGPAVTRYELQPSAGVKISKITGLADDIALNLAASGVRIEAPIPGKPAVGIEVPNKTVGTVGIREIIDSQTFADHSSHLAVALGKDIAGSVTVGDIAKMPHVLIAGATGSGKSVCINAIIISLLYKSSPEEVRLLMVDPKVVELGIYNGIPHLLVPVVTDPKKAAGALSWAVNEMLGRYKLFADNSVRDLKGFNNLAKTREDLTPMPQIVIIIDELADLMMAAPNDVEDAICRLAQMARAAGMHLVIATQRPSVDVITGVIKANIPSRIAFAVSSQVDSRTILDSSGAEKLLGRGDMLFYPVGASKPVRVQCSYVSDEEVERVTEYIKKSKTPDYDETVMDEIEKQAAMTKDNKKKDSGGGDDSEGSDPMLEEAIECVVEAGQASTSMLQRRLKLGYARAARVMDQLEERGIIGPYEGAKPREVLITRDQLYEMKLNSQD